MKIRHLFVIVSVVLLGLTSGLVYHFVQSQVEPALRQQAVRVAQGQVQTIGASVSDDLSTASTLVRAMAKSVEDAPLTHADIKSRIPAVIDQYGNPSIAGGGIWPEAGRLTPDKDRDSLFWAREDNGSLGFLDQYNNPSEAPYRSEPWYTVGPKLKPGQIAWSQAYQDPVSKVTMVTATAAIHRDGTFWGVATMDFSLGGLDDILKNAAKESGGTLVVSDAQGMIIAAPSLRKDLAMKTWEEVTKSDPSLAPLAKAITDAKNGVGLARGVLPEENSVYLSATMKQQQWKVSMLVPASVALQESQQIQRGLFTLFIPVLAVFTLILTGLTWWALSRVVATSRQIRHMAQGRVTERLQDRGRSEVAELRKAVNSYGDHLTQIITQVVTGSAQMQDSASHLDELSTALRDRSNAQVQLNTSMQGSIGQLTEAAGEISANTSAAASRAEEAGQAIREGAKVMSDNREAAGHLTQTMERAQEVLQELAQATEKVGGTLKMITEISEQTNLLALNATIEAARAGDAGKGFAVVASEVGALAGETKKSTATIDSLLGAFRASAQEAIAVIEESMQISVESRQRAEVVDATYSEISDAFEDIKSRTVSIASAAEEQVAVTQEISRQSDEVAQATEETTTQAAELYEHAMQVREVSERLASLDSGQNPGAVRA